MEIPVLETARLRLRGLREEDLDAYAGMCADADVMRYLRGHPIDRAEAWREMAMLAGHWALRGYGTWAVEERESGRFAGRLGLHYPEGWPDRELGWALARECWGRGYAAEGCRVALEYAFTTLGWPRAVSLIHSQNERSKRLATRLGMRFERVVNVRGVDVEMFGAEPGR
jgi:RimJ/RimL family protein N-acetyltransferase